MKRLTSALMGLTLMLTFAVSAFARRLLQRRILLRQRRMLQDAKSQRSKFPLIEAGGRCLASFIRLIRFHSQLILAIRIFQRLRSNAVL